MGCVPSAAAQHLLRQRRLRSRGLRAAMRALFALFLSFLDAFQRLVDPDREELDHRILHAHTAFEFLHGFGSGGELEQHIVAFAMLLHAIGKPAFAPFIDFVHRASGMRSRFWTSVR